MVTLVCNLELKAASATLFGAGITLGGVLWYRAQMTSGGGYGFRGIAMSEGGSLTAAGGR